MDEMDVDQLSVRSRSRCRKLRESVDRYFCRTPIKLVPPIRDEPPHVVEICAIGPAGIIKLIGPSSSLEATPKILQDLIGYGDRKWFRSGHSNRARKAEF